MTMDECAVVQIEGKGRISIHDGGVLKLDKAGHLIIGKTNDDSFDLSVMGAGALRVSSVGATNDAE